MPISRRLIAAVAVLTLLIVVALGFVIYGFAKTYGQLK